MWGVFCEFKVWSVFCLVYWSAVHWNGSAIIFRADSRFAPSQWETALLCNAVSHWLGTSLESILVLKNQFSSLATWDVLNETNFSASKDENFVKMMTFLSHCNNFRCSQSKKCHQNDDIHFCVGNAMLFRLFKTGIDYRYIFFVYKQVASSLLPLRAEH